MLYIVKRIFASYLLKVSVKGNTWKVNLLPNHFQIMSKDASLWIYFKIFVTIVETDTSNESLHVFLWVTYNEYFKFYSRVFLNMQKNTTVFSDMIPFYNDEM